MCSERWELSGFTAEVALINDIESGEQLRDLLKTGKLNVALINPKLIADVWQLKVAVYNALRGRSEKKCKTNTVYTEIIFSLSPHSQIASSLVQFGMQANHRSCIAVAVGDQASDDMKHLLETVPECTVLPIDSLSDFSDVESIKSAYDIADKELEVSSLRDSVVNRMAAKCCL